MQKYTRVLFLFSIQMLLGNGLKLLVTDEKVLEDDDDTWESDIEFAYKPFKGKCVNPAGIISTAGGAGGYTGAGTLFNLACDTTGSNTAADVAKYCTALHNGGKYSEAFTALKAKQWYWKKFIHYTAKLASMSNVKAVAENKHPVKSFEVHDAPAIADRTAVFMTSVATAGTGPYVDKAYFCYTEAGMTWAKNDPKVKNMDGQEFEIMATGTFSLLNLKKSSQTLFEASATIDRAGTLCGATYIQNVTLSGQWVEDTGAPSIQVKAEAAVPKLKALKINFNGEWQHAASHLSSAAVKAADAKKLTLKLNELEVMVSIDSHRIQDGQLKSKRFANFLNVNFGRVTHLVGLSMGGLLGKDSHEAATQLPEECESAELVSSDGSRMLSLVDMM